MNIKIQILFKKIKEKIKNIFINNNLIEKKYLKNKYKNYKKKENNLKQKETLILKRKIREQKKILRDKIEQARRNALATEKKSEIERVEYQIQELLSKHSIKEDDLKENCSKKQKNKWEIKNILKSRIVRIRIKKCLLIWKSEKVKNKKQTIYSHIVRYKKHQ